VFDADVGDDVVGVAQPRPDEAAQAGRAGVPSPVGLTEYLPAADGAEAQADHHPLPRLDEGRQHLARLAFLGGPVERVNGPRREGRQPAQLLPASVEGVLEGRGGPPGALFVDQEVVGDVLDLLR
jgi:hypothetical protein